MEVERNHILIDKHLVNGPLKHAFFSYILKDRAIFRNLLANRYVEKKQGQEFNNKLKEHISELYATKKR